LKKEFRQRQREKKFGQGQREIFFGATTTEMATRKALLSKPWAKPHSPTNDVIFNKNKISKINGKCSV